MGEVNKKDLSERDICTKYITPALQRAGWDLLTQVREEVTFTKGRVIAKGKLRSRGESRRADYVLYFKPTLPIAVIEAKENNHTVSAGMQTNVIAAALQKTRPGGRFSITFPQQPKSV